MAKLTKVQARDHAIALRFLEEAKATFGNSLTDERKEFIFEHFHEGANHINGEAGAFFTPYPLAYDAVLELGFYVSKGKRVIDLCAGIGVLAYAALQRFPELELVCVELNKEYYEVGKLLVPEATWIHADVMDIHHMRELGHFDAAISNPPFGKVRTFRDSRAPRYTGAEAEYKVIDLAAEISDTGVFILPQKSAGYKYSGQRCFEPYPNDELVKFQKQTGIEIGLGMGIDTTTEDYGQFKNTKIRVEIATGEFENCIRSEEQNELFA